MSLPKWNSKRKEIQGGGLFTSNPPALPQASSSSFHSSTIHSNSNLNYDPRSENDDEEFDLIASSEASTSRNPFDRLSERSVRETSADSTMIDDPEVDFSNGKKRKMKATPKSLAKASVVKKKQKSTTKESDFVSNIPWPEHFKELEKTFKALNTIYTFSSARKHMSTTFETLKGGVENLLRRPLEIHDIAQIKALLPLLISFAYIDSELLRVNPNASSSTQKRMKKTHDLDLAYEIAGAPDVTQKEEEKTVLLFSFNDGEVKSSNGAGKIISRKFSKKPKKGDEPTKKPIEKEPKFTTESMIALIAKRNSKFSSAVHELLAACEVHDPPQDAVELLLSATEENLPVRPEGDDEERKGVGELRGDFEFYRKNPDARPSIARIIEEIKSGEDYRDQIVDGGHKISDSREADYGTLLDTDLSTSLWDALYSTKSITQLYAHQATAINHLDNHQSVIVSTSTSSGKSLIYQIPVLKALEEDSSSTAMYIFPTKALAQDQKRALSEILSNWENRDFDHENGNFVIANFDGDTPREHRDSIRENANVIFTNPDMLHITILPREESWRRFFRNLKIVVLDEIHMYNGLFGVHVAFIMRRLRRVCHAVGNDSVLFISCSATISNPAEHMEQMFGIKNVAVVDVDGSPTGRKEHLVWNPPRIDDNDVKQGRVSSIAETSRIFRFLLDRGIRAIVFCKVRQQCEIMMKQVRADLMVEGRSDMAARVMSYRSGYSAADRRKIEEQMFSGELVGIISTTALELGVDIGSLDAVITVGFPYTLSGIRQQAGRAGRRKKDSLALFICDPFPLDQHYARNPEEIFSSPFTKLSLDLTNQIVLEAHIQCAAFEVPIQPEEDQTYFGPTLPQICLDKLVEDSAGFFHSHPRYLPSPSRTVSIRSTEDEVYSIIDISDGRNSIIEEIEFSRAIFTIYTGAIFFHMGRSYLVKEVDHDRKLARVEAATLDYQTRQRDFTNVDALEALAIRELPDTDCVATYGTVQITSIVFGYFKTDRRNNILDTVDISSPPFTRESHGFWIDVPSRALEILVKKNIHPAGSIHAAEHALMSLTPLVASSAEGDVRTECKQPEKELANTPSSRKRPARLILYDSAGKSGGICAKAFDHISILLASAADTISNCRCSEGCPSCVASTICSGANTIVSKLGALVVLESILGRTIDVDAIPMQEPLVGSVPGGSIDLVGAGLKVEKGVVALGLMEEEEMGEDEIIEREAALAELLNM